MYATQIPKHITRFVVEGGGTFPLDMLRYDSAWPASEYDAGLITDAIEHKTGRRRVTLLTVTSRITERRWESFNWKIVEPQHHRDGGGA